MSRVNLFKETFRYITSLFNQVILGFWGSKNLVAKAWEIEWPAIPAGQESTYCSLKN